MWPTIYTLVVNKFLSCNLLHDALNIHNILNKDDSWSWTKDFAIERNIIIVENWDNGPCDWRVLGNENDFFLSNM